VGFLAATGQPIPTTGYLLFHPNRCQIGCNSMPTTNWLW